MVFCLPLSTNSLIINQLQNSLLSINQLHIINKNIYKIVNKRLGILSSLPYLYIYQTIKTNNYEFIKFKNNQFSIKHYRKRMVSFIKRK